MLAPSPRRLQQVDKRGGRFIKGQSVPGKREQYERIEGHEKRQKGGAHTRYTQQRHRCRCRHGERCPENGGVEVSAVVEPRSKRVDHRPRVEPSRDDHRDHPEDAQRQPASMRRHARQIIQPESREHDH